ncbi:kinase-like domain-containing protein [Rhizophagus irregularis DAOM 181602=DAOM 197198]|nr:kinase-like domain-containing protein [Rhizophagus irregularis DAOM 181602=DAOM 197198]
MSRTRYSSLFYEGYIYDGYLYTLALQLIEDAYYIDPAVLTIEEKQSMFIGTKSQSYAFNAIENSQSTSASSFSPSKLANIQGGKEIKKIVTILVI